MRVAFGDLVASVEVLPSLSDRKVLYLDEPRAQLLALTIETLLTSLYLYRFRGKQAII